MKRDLIRTGAGNRREPYKGEGTGGMNVDGKKRKKRELGHLRGRLLGSARGRVLELGVGAGANFPFYRQDVELTAVDFSPVMIEKARAANDREYGLSVRFVTGDVERLALPEGSFDTVVSTLSLCAYRDPKRVLDNMSRWCKPGGRVLLMEHGLSTCRAVAWAQKALDPLACRWIGCHQNLDIPGLVQASPLRIERAERHMLGVLHLLWCRPATAGPGSSGVEQERKARERS